MSCQNASSSPSPPSSCHLVSSWGDSLRGGCHLGVILPTLSGQPLAMSGDVFGCHNWGCYWHLVGGS